MKEEHENLLKDNNIPNIIYISTDGSGIKTHIDAVAYSSIISISIHHYLGKTDIANVYAVELTAIHLRIKMAGKSHEQFDKCIIFIDNQSSI